MAEALLRSLTEGRADVHSAGTVPQPEIHPMAVALMRDKYRIDVSSQFPKTLDRYIGQHFDYVITVCDNAAETCPVFPGAPERIHWSFPDPAAAPEEMRARAFDEVAADIAGRLRIWLALPDVQARLAAG